MKEKLAKQFPNSEAASKRYNQTRTNFEEIDQDCILPKNNPILESGSKFQNAVYSETLSQLKQFKDSMLTPHLSNQPAHPQLIEPPLLNLRNQNATVPSSTTTTSELSETTSESTDQENNFGDALYCRAMDKLENIRAQRNCKNFEKQKPDLATEAISDQYTSMEFLEIPSRNKVETASTMMKNRQESFLDKEPLCRSSCENQGNISEENANENARSDFILEDFAETFLYLAEHVAELTKEQEQLRNAMDLMIQYCLPNSAQTETRESNLPGSGEEEMKMPPIEEINEKMNDWEENQEGQASEHTCKSSGKRVFFEMDEHSSSNPSPAQRECGNMNMMLENISIRESLGQTLQLISQSQQAILSNSMELQQLKAHVDQLFQIAESFQINNSGFLVDRRTLPIAQGDSNIEPKFTTTLIPPSFGEPCCSSGHPQSNQVDTRNKYEEQTIGNIRVASEADTKEKTQLSGSIRDTIFNEVAILIGQHENRPSFLLQLYFNSLFHYFIYIFSCFF